MMMKLLNTKIQKSYKMAMWNNYKKQTLKDIKLYFLTLKEIVGIIFAMLGIIALILILGR